MSFTVYILRSIPTGRHYIGYTSEINQRLERHNAGLVRSSKPYLPWELIYTEEFADKSSAMRRELEIKSYKGGIQFKALIGE
ncbi:MAG: GIY-YIG nuclease family protein [Ignavibacteriales bacterium]|nr:GIY-YIG nuclease family protein [Ignavibacteriales bacterium]